jgi:outer membrane biosynthesis protein TonB
MTPSSLRKRGNRSVMRRDCCALALSLLIICLSLAAQEAARSGTPAVGQASAQSDGYGVYTSGYQVLSRGNTPATLKDYGSDILSKVRTQWYQQIPKLQAAVGRKQGLAIIEFEIARDGSLSRMTAAASAAASASDGTLDYAAWNAVSDSAPFPPLPDTYPEKALKLRMQFGYDQPPDASAPICDGPNWGAHSKGVVLYRVVEGMTPPKATSAPDPEYSTKAREEKYLSVVEIAGTVDTDGSFTDLCITQSAGRV